MDEAQKKYNSLSCFGRITPIQPVNDEFTLCKVYIASTGCNRNYSYISRETMDAAMPTLGYIPVVGHLLTKYDENGKEIGKYFGGHDYVWDSNWNYVAQTVPFGVVVNDSYEYETVVEYGTELEYLTAHAILWTGRYPDMKEAIYSDDIWFGQSMEIIVAQDRPYANDSNYSEILEYSYSALCILGKSDDPEYHTEPCFISSKFVPLSYGLEREQFNVDMCEMRKRLAFLLSPKEGGETPMDMEKIVSILAEFNLTTDMVEFDFAEMDENALREAAQEYVDAHSGAGEGDPDPASGEGGNFDDNGSDNGEGGDVPPVASDPGEEGTKEFICEFAATYNQRLNALRNALDDDVVINSDGIVMAATSYWIKDFDDNHVYVERYLWRADGDSHEDNGRFGYSLDENNVATITSDFELMHLMWLTTEEKNKLEASRNVFEQMTQELENLKQYKANNEQSKRKEAVDNLFSQFDDLQVLEGFEALRNSAYESGEMEDIETKLYAMRGRMAKTFSKNPAKGVVRVGIETNAASGDERPYGGLLKKH